MRKILFVDNEKCNGCRVCEVYCSLVKTKTCNPARSRIGIISWEEKGFSSAVVCHQCEDAPCAAGCTVEAISKDRETGLVSINYQRCIGCRSCLEACPFGAMSVDPIDNKVFKCDLCGGDPWCSKMCPTGAVTFIDADKIAMGRRRECFENFSNLVRNVLDNNAEGK